MTAKSSVTPFQCRVYAAVRRIPRGAVATYAAVAGAVDCASARVIGQALRRCEDPSVPCHRVVGAGGTLGGYGGQSTGAPVTEKTRLLRAEGVRVSISGKIPPDRLLRDSPATRRLLRGD